MGLDMIDVLPIAVDVDAGIVSTNKTNITITIIPSLSAFRRRIHQSQVLRCTVIIN